LEPASGSTTTLLEDTTTATAHLRVEALPPMVAQAAGAAFQKAGAYYFRCMARMQRLWELATSFSRDVSARDVEVSG
jgi:7-keto-8-aminopelargonate synthetase-like enzyme